MVMVTAPVLSYGLCRFASHYSPPKNYWLLGMARILSLAMRLFECQVEQGLFEYPLEAPAGAAIAPERG